MRALVLAAMLSGCYSATPGTGAPCDERSVCPRDQVCVNGRCEPEGTLPAEDAALADAPPDAGTDGSAMQGAWSNPTIVGIMVGSSKGDPSFSADRLTVVFERNDDLMIATRPAIGGAWTVADLDELSGTSEEKSPEISADGDTIYFASNDDGDHDIYVSTLVAGVWTDPQPVPSWATASSEQDVAISPDELTAWVAVSGDIRRATRGSVADPWPPPIDMNIAWGSGATAPSINASGDVYFHAGDPRDLFVVRKTGASTYAAPVPVGELNTSARDAAPFISADDRHIMFERAGELLESSR